MCKESACFLWMNRNYRNSREYSFLKEIAVMRRNFHFICIIDSMI